MGAWRACPPRRPRRSSTAAAAPPPRPRAIEAANMAIANGHPNSPAVYTIPSGELRGDATMKATIGAQGMVLAIIPSTTAVVPHEQKGVPTAAAVARTTPAPRCRARKAESLRASTRCFRATAIAMLARRKGQLCRSESATCPRVRWTRSVKESMTTLRRVNVGHPRGRGCSGEKTQDFCRSAGTAPAAAFVVVDDPAQPVELEVAAVEEELPKLLPRALDPRFGPRQRDAGPVGVLLLAQAFVLGRDERFPVRRGKLVDGLPQRERQARPWILFEGEALRRRDGRSRVPRPACGVGSDR